MNHTRALPATSASSEKSNPAARIALAVAAGAMIAFLSACAPKYYSSNSQNVPLLTSEGQGSVSGSVNGDASRADVRGSFAVGPNLGVLANAALYFPRDDDSGNGGSGGLFEAGVGYFKPLPNNLVFETYGLVAYGGLENHFETANPNGKLNANLTRFSVQPSLGYKHRYVEAAASSRLAMLNYFNVSGDLIRDGESQAQFLRDNRMQFLMEPALTLRAGSDMLKAEAQIGWSVNLTDDTFPQDKNWVSLGLVYSIR